MKLIKKKKEVYLYILIKHGIYINEVRLRFRGPFFHLTQLKMDMNIFHILKYFIKTCAHVNINK